MGGRAGSFTARQRSIARGRAPTARALGADASKDGDIFSEAGAVNQTIRALKVDREPTQRKPE